MTERHFELLADSGRGWSVHEVLDDRKMALARGKVLKEEAGAIAVKVNQVEFDASSGGFSEKEVFFIGDRLPDPPKGGDADGGPNCSKTKEYYRSSSRQLIRRVLSRWLDSLSITPTELLHHVEHMKRLDNAGTTLQGAVQQVARMQVRLTGQDVQTRQKELYDLGDEIFRETVLRWRDNPPPKLAEDDPDALVKSLEGQTEGQFLFLCAVSDWLRPLKSISEKMFATLDLLAKSKNPNTISYLDILFSDFVDNPIFLRTIVGEDMQLGEAVVAAIRMLNGDGGDKIAPEFKPFLTNMGTGKLVRCRETLLRKIETTLSSHRPFFDGMPLQEAQFNKTIRRLLELPNDEFIGGFEMQDAFNTRSERLVTPTAIGRLLEGLEKAEERISIILEMSSYIYGGGNIRRLGEYFLPIVQQPAYQNEWMQKKEPAAKRMQALVELQQRIANSDLSQRHKDVGGECIDGICLEVMKEGRVFERVASSAGTPVAAGMALLRLYSTGIFTQGKTMKTARTQVLAILRSSDFVAALLSPAANSEEKKDTLVELSHLLQRSDLPETPLSAALLAAIE